VIVLLWIRDQFKQIWSQVRPPAPFSWQMLIVLSLFSWTVSILVQTPLVRDILATAGWIFLSLGIGWATVNLKIPILGFKISPGSWLTAGLLTGLIYGWFPIPYQAALMIWPLITAAIATVPRFLAPGPSLRVPKVGDRQAIVLTILLHSLITCWVGLFVVVQSWVQQYPSTLADDFSASAFVVKLSTDFSDESRRPRRGVALLDDIENRLRQQMGSGSWTAAVRWLIDNRPEFASLTTGLNNPDQPELDSPQEADLWEIAPFRLIQDPDVRDGFIMIIRAQWLGPSSRPDGFYLERRCRLLEGRPGVLPDTRGLPDLFSDRPDIENVIIRCTTTERVQYSDDPTEPPSDTARKSVPLG
jgi:hypothetical protein